MFYIFQCVFQCRISYFYFSATRRNCISVVFEKLHPFDKTVNETGDQVIKDSAQIKNDDFKVNLSRWERQRHCSGAGCQIINYKNGKAFWKHTKRNTKKTAIETPHILKGGGDDVGPALAVQRVYIDSVEKGSLLKRYLSISRKKEKKKKTFS